METRPAERTLVYPCRNRPASWPQMPLVPTGNEAPAYVLPDTSPITMLPPAAVIFEMSALIASILLAVTAPAWILSAVTAFTANLSVETAPAAILSVVIDPA